MSNSGQKGTNFDQWLDSYAARANTLSVSEVRALFAVVSRPEVVSLARSVPSLANALLVMATARSVPSLANARSVRSQGSAQHVTVTGLSVMLRRESTQSRGRPRVPKRRQQHRLTHLANRS